MRIIRRNHMHPDIRLIGTVIRWIMPKFTRQSLFKLSEKCEKFLTGRWLGKHTTVEPRYIERPDGTKLRILICRSREGAKPNATGLLWIHGGGMPVRPKALLY